MIDRANLRRAIVAAYNAESLELGSPGLDILAQLLAFAGFPERELAPLLTPLAVESPLMREVMLAVRGAVRQSGAEPATLSQVLDCSAELAEVDAMEKSWEREWGAKLRDAVDACRRRVWTRRGDAGAPICSGPTGHRVELQIDGWDLHELYTVLVDPNGPEGCCAGCSLLPEGWCANCDQNRKAARERS